MTAEPDLLPMPELVEEGLYYFSVRAAGGDVYVRAIREHIAAKNAEIVELRSTIEALRAEVELLRRGIVPRDDDMIVPVKLLDEINASGAEWKARAERLAEVLRELATLTKALRAEVALLRVGMENERLHQRGLLDRERERAEQLVESLRKIAALTEEFDDLDDAVGIANEALKQEAGHG